jgi:hypothetical protein
LRVVQSERRRISGAVMCVDVRNSFMLAGKKCVKQFLSLAFELFEIRMLAKRASWKRLIHGELLSCRPLSAISGRKEFI